MYHPFAKPVVLSNEEQQRVSGASVDLRNLLIERPGSPTPIKRPSIGTTLAIGEEGGGSPDVEF